MKYLVEIRVQVCSAFVLIKNGTKVHFLKWMDFFGGGREINTNKKALLKKLKPLIFFQQENFEMEGISPNVFVIQWKSFLQFYLRYL